MPALTISNEARASVPRAGFRAMKDAILGASYKLDLVFTTPARMKKLNKIYRNIDKPTDILSFPLSRKEGAMYVCLSEARKEAPKFDRTATDFIPFLFIHGCVHLKGYDHGGTMERIEDRFRKRFGI